MWLGLSSPHWCSLLLHNNKGDNMVFPTLFASLDTIIPCSHCHWATSGTCVELKGCVSSFISLALLLAKCRVLYNLGQGRASGGETWVSEPLHGRLCAHRNICTFPREKQHQCAKPLRELQSVCHGHEWVLLWGQCKWKCWLHLCWLSMVYLLYPEQRPHMVPVKLIYTLGKNQEGQGNCSVSAIKW